MTESQGIREWIADHYPTAMPWQIDVAELTVHARREGRTLQWPKARQSGWTYTNNMIREYLKETTA